MLIYAYQLIIKNTNLNWLKEMRILLILAKDLRLENEEFWNSAILKIREYLKDGFIKSVEREVKSLILLPMEKSENRATYTKQELTSSNESASHSIWVNESHVKSISNFESLIHNNDNVSEELENPKEGEKFYNNLNYYYKNGTEEKTKLKLKRQIIQESQCDMTENACVEYLGLILKVFSNIKNINLSNFGFIREILFGFDLFEKRNSLFILNFVLKYCSKICADPTFKNVWIDYLDLFPYEIRNFLADGKIYNAISLYSKIEERSINQLIQFNTLDKENSNCNDTYKKTKNLSKIGMFFDLLNLMSHSFSIDMNIPKLMSEYFIDMLLSEELKSQTNVSMLYNKSFIYQEIKSLIPTNKIKEQDFEIFQESLLENLERIYLSNTSSISKRVAENLVFNLSDAYIISKMDLMKYIQRMNKKNELV